MYQPLSKWGRTLWLSADFPRKVEDLMPVFEVLSPRNKHFQKLQDFVKLLPTDGFPVKVGTHLPPPVSHLPPLTLRCDR